MTLAMTGNKTSAKYDLPHQLPYLEKYAKRIPVLQVFRMALASFHASQSHHPFAAINRLLTQLSQGGAYFAAECGVYRGSSLIACAEIARDYQLPVHFYGLDTFAGFPEFSQQDEALTPDVLKEKLEQKGNLFADTSIEAVQKKIDQRKLSRAISLIPGKFNDTLKTLPNQEYFFVNIDCDLYEPHLECLEYFYPRTAPGGIIFFDDYESVIFPMAKKAIDEFMAGRPERLFYIRYGDEQPNHTKAFIVKF